MIIVCPHCKKRSRVDEKKLPSQALPVSCPHCSSTFFISRHGVELPVNFPPPQQIDTFSDTFSSGTEDQKTRDIPWSHRSSIFDLRSFFYTAREILLRPQDTFQNCAPEKYFNDSLLFLIIFGSLGKILNEYWFYLGSTLFGNVQSGPLGSAVGFTISILFTPIGLIIGTFIYASITHVTLHLLKAARQSWHATFSTIAWVTGSVSLLSIIPILGAIAASIWGFIATMKGLKVVHRTSTFRAFLALTLPGLLIFAFLIFVVLAILGTTLFFGISQFLEILQHTHRLPI